MIWQIDTVSDLVEAFTDAGDIDEQVIAAYLATTRQPQHEQKRPDIRRWYYLLKDNPRVSLCCVGMPLDAWQGPAMLIVGTREIIGEFAGNRAVRGKLGLQLKMQPLAWMSGDPGRRFAKGSQMLAEISEQVLDLRPASRVQENDKKRFRRRGVGNDR
jgi:hypothetical protein